jgi:hypothetical protein
MKENIRLAVDEAERKLNLGLLAWEEIPDQEETSEEDMNAFWCTPHGDRETIYSIASCYGSENIGGEGNEDEILNVLVELYPNLAY